MRWEGYDTYNFKDTNILEIKRTPDSSIDSDEDAVQQAIKDGINIIPDEETPPILLKQCTGLIDTQENRNAIKEYMETQKI
jgi:hypothetical protein